MYYFTNNNFSALSMASTVQDKIKQAQSAPKSILASLDRKNNSTQSLSPNKTRVLYKSNQELIKEKSRTTKFSYYAVLPTLDVPVGFAKPINTNPKMVSGDSKASTKTLELAIAADEPLIEESAKKKQVKEGGYLLQVASYKKRSRAKLTRGRLNKSGIEARIQAKKVKGRMWYRVVAGPVDHGSINNWKNKAERMGHRPLVISLR